MESDSSSPLTSYGATRTTFFTVTITAPANTNSVSIYYPFPAITPAPQYTTVSGSITDLFSVLPVLVLTDVVGVVVSTNGVPLKTGTLVQHATSPSPSPAVESGNGNGNWAVAADDCSTSTSAKAWKCWSLGKQAGAGVGIAVAAIVILAGLLWICCCKPRKKMMRDLEDANVTGREKVAFGWGGWPFGGRKKGESVIPREEGHKKSTIIEIPPTFHGGVSKYRVVPPNPREAIRRAAEMPPEPADPPPTHQLPKRRIEIPPDPSLSALPKRSSQRSSYYYPKTHDFAYPAAGAAGAGIAAAFTSKPRRRSPQRRQSTKEERKSTAWAPSALPIISPADIPRRKSKRQSRREDSGDRDTRREYRKRDSDREHGSGRERGRERESRETRGERDKAPESRKKRHVSRERRARSASPPRKPKPKRRSKSLPKPKKRSWGSNAKWLALLPVALEAIPEIAEPNGGWDQYHKQSSKAKAKAKDRRRKARSVSPGSSNENENDYIASPQPRRTYRTTWASTGDFADGHAESRPRRSRSADRAARRDSSPDDFTFTARRERRRMNEEAQRRPRTFRNLRPRDRYKADYDGAMSSGDEGFHGSGSMASDNGDGNRHAMYGEEASKSRLRLTV